MSVSVLNPTLHRRLGRRFGAVKVSGAGEAMVAKAVKDAQDRPELLIEHAGEYYQVNCPYCRDTRHRLYVNHRFGQLDAFGRRLNFLAICYNEGCLGRRDNLIDFLEQLEAADLSDAVVQKGRVVPEEAREVLPPGPTIPLSRLRRAHPARVYVQSRGFDPDELAEKFDVSYCTNSRYTLARDRLIIPVYEHGKLRGWQARFIGELDWKGPKKKELPPKYFSCPDSHFRSKCVYGLETMAQWETGIVVEGPTDRFRMGSMSGCIFGNSMTEVQKRKFLAVFRKRTGVLLLDPEEYESKSTQKTVAFMQDAMKGRFCAVKLPDGTDPGKLSREFLRAYVKQEAAAQGVKVQYRKVT